MEENVFRFKQFQVNHGKGSMKVGVDAVLIGSWAGKNSKMILDVGTGCGIISLMMAQRFKDARIIGIDIDEASIEETKFNFDQSPWATRLSCYNMEFPKDIIKFNQKFDLIISNPPYFKSGISTPVTSREKARHQDTLTVFSLIKHASEIMTDDGRLAMIFPTDFLEEVEAYATKTKLNILRMCKIRNKHSSKAKRVMVEFGFFSLTLEKRMNEELTMFAEGFPTEEYRQLCGDFYLYF